MPTTSHLAHELHMKAMVSNAGLHFALVQRKQAFYTPLPTTKLCKPAKYVPNDTCHEPHPTSSSEARCVLLLLCAIEPAWTCPWAPADLPGSAASPPANSPCWRSGLFSTSMPTQPNWPSYTAIQHAWTARELQTAQKAQADHPLRVNCRLTDYPPATSSFNSVLKYYYVIEATFINWNTGEIRLRIRNHISNFY